jgi:hypothetical protein
LSIRGPRLRLDELSVGDIHPDAAPKLARGATTHQHPYRLRVLAHHDEAAASLRPG